MSQLITTAYAQEYAHTVELLLQQRGSKMAPLVSPMSITGAKAGTVCEQIGLVEAKKRTTRYPALTPQDTPHDRPWVYPSDYDWNDLIDSIDKLRTAADPQSAYAQNGMYALGRAQDREIFAAFFGDRKTGEDGATTISWTGGATNEGTAQVVAVNFGAAGNVGLTVAKLREAKRILMAAEVDFENDPATIAVKAKQHDNLLAEIQVISLDFNEKPVMVEGMVTRFLGFNVKQTELVPADATPFDRAPVFMKSGMVLATWNGITSDISRRKDLAGLPWQIYVYGTFGSTRKEAKKLVEIKCA